MSSKEGIPPTSCTDAVLRAIEQEGVDEAIATLGVNVPGLFDKLVSEVKGLKRAVTSLIKIKNQRRWKTIDVGSQEATRRQLNSKQWDLVHFCGDVEDVLHHSDFAAGQKKARIPLYRCAIRDLCLDKVEYEKALARLEVLGYGQCPDSTAPVVRFLHLNQPENEDLVAMTRPLPVAEGTPKLLVLSRDDDSLEMAAIKASGQLYGKVLVYTRL